MIDDLSKGLLSNVPNCTPLIVQDVSQQDVIGTVLSDSQHFDAVIHCAAQASVVVSTSNPAFDLNANVTGTINALEIARLSECPFVFASTGGAIYGGHATRPTGESETVAPGAPYGASKAAAEIYVRLWERTHGSPHAILRLGNVYGPRQRGDGEAGVVAIFSERLASGQAVTLFGHGSPTRDYVHVEDVARAFLSAVGKSGTFNVATGVETSVADVYSLIAATLGIAAIPPDTADLRPGELAASCLDITRALTQLNWLPSIDVTTGIPQTALALAGRA